MKAGEDGDPRRPMTTRWSGQSSAVSIKYSPAPSETTRSIFGIEVLDVRLFVDSVFVAFEDLPDRDTRDRLQALNGRGRVFPIVDKKKLRQLGLVLQYHSLLVVHQPQPMAMRRLAMMSGPHAVVQIDVAIDPITESWLEARELQPLLHRHVVLPYHRKGHFVQYTTEDGGWTVYLNSGTARRGLRGYSRRPPGKHIPQSRAHIEVMMRGAEACRQVGVSTAYDLVGIDLRRIVCECDRIRFYEIDNPKAFDDAVERYLTGLARRQHSAARAKGVPNTNPVIRRRWLVDELRKLLFGRFANEQRWHEAPMQLLRDALPQHITNKYLVKLDPAELLGLPL